MKRIGLLLLAVAILIVGLDVAAYKCAKVEGKTPDYPVAIERIDERVALSCFGYTVYFPLP